MAVSISDIIQQNTVGYSDGYPLGVPESWAFYKGSHVDAGAPPSDFTAVTGWGAVYQEAGAPAYSNPNATVDVANAKTYVHLKSTGEWVLVQDQASTGIAGGHFVSDFSGNAAIAMNVTTLPGGTAALDSPPAGYNDHFWPTARGAYSAGAVDAVYVQMDMKVSDPNLHLVAQVGADWWRSTSASYVNGFNNNPGVGTSNWTELSTQWTTLGFYSSSTAQFQADLPPSLLGSAQTVPVVGSPDTVAPPAPKIASFTPDTGTVGDKITSASVLTLTGTAEAGSTVKVFDKATQIGTAAANASGAWSLATTQLSSGAHNFTATATDAAGNTSSASAALSVKVDATSLPVTSPPAAGANLLVNGSFEASPLSAGRWAAFSSVPGWTALTGGTIELWNNLNNVKATDGVNYGELDYLGARDGFYQNVKTVAGQSYELSFDARSRPGFTASTTTIEVLWNDKVVASVDPGSAGSSWKTFNFTVTGTGGQDRLTFRESAGQSADGLGALYDNVSLVAVSKASAVQPSVQQSAVSQKPMDLVTQYAATTFTDSGASFGAALNSNDLVASLGQTLAKGH